MENPIEVEENCGYPYFRKPPYIDLYMHMFVYLHIYLYVGKQMQVCIFIS